MEARFQKRREELRAIQLGKQLVLDLQTSINRATQHGQTPSWMEQRCLTTIQQLLALQNGA